MYPAPWSNSEIELIINDYFRMLKDEISGKKVNKASHVRALIPLLNNRNRGAIEFKHPNISAVLIKLGQPYIKGYLPRYNYQKVLEDFVIDYLIKDSTIENVFLEFSEKEIRTPVKNFQEKSFIVDPPALLKKSRELDISIQRNPIKVNYLQREQSNNRLGKSGEELVLEFEKWNLILHGKEKLAEQVEWISQERGDGAGFDILSRQLDGTDKYIEVKTTKLGKETPFFFTQNELQFSVENKQKFHLYRLFNFDLQPKMFIKNGDLKSICNFVPIIYRGYF